MDMMEFMLDIIKVSQDISQDKEELEYFKQDINQLVDITNQVDIINQVDMVDQVDIVNQEAFNLKVNQEANINKDQWHQNQEEEYKLNFIDQVIINFNNLVGMANHNYFINLAIKNNFIEEQLLEEEVTNQVDDKDLKYLIMDIINYIQVGILEVAKGLIGLVNYINKLLIKDTISHMKVSIIRLMDIIKYQYYKQMILVMELKLDLLDNLHL